MIHVHTHTHTHNPVYTMPLIWISGVSGSISTVFMFLSVQVFNQDVDVHAADLSRVTEREEDLFDTELPTIQLCEEHLAVASEERKLVLPDWLERAGAPEAVEVGADLRNRFNGLKTSLGERVDQATQLLASVLVYEADYDSLNEWLLEEVATVGSLPSPALSVEGLNQQLAQVEVCDYGQIDLS